MAKELFNSDFYTLPEQVQINKEDIKTNTASIATNTANIATNTSDITKLQDDIGKIKPNAWEQRKFNVDIGEGTLVEFTTYNPITDTNAPVNAQKSFINKDTYSIMDSINSYSFFASGSFEGADTSIYAICTDPSNQLFNLLSLDDQEESGVLISLVCTKDNTSGTETSLYINCTEIRTNRITSKSITIKDNDGNVKNINKITDNDDNSFNSLLTAFAIDNYYLKKTDASNTYLTKTDASNTYLTKTDASNTYVTKQDYDNRFEKAILTLTESGFNKIKNMVENEGTTITLTDTSDYTEQVPPINPHNMKEIRLYVKYGVESIYSNIHLVPNTTTDDYNNLQGSLDSYWYTGHAMLNLPSQDNGYFVIAYQKGTCLILRLIMHY